jgi:hypothetical protein
MNSPPARQTLEATGNRELREVPLTDQAIRVPQPAVTRNGPGMP